MSLLKSCVGLRSKDQNKRQRLAFKLYQAVEQRDLNQIKRLLDRRACADLNVEQGRSALALACREGYKDAVRLFLAYRTHVNCVAVNPAVAVVDEVPPLVDAVFESHVDIVKDLLKAGAKVNVLVRGRHFLNTEEDMTAVHVAAGRGNTEIMNLLLDNGADIEKETSAGNTPLHVAARYGRCEVIQLLADRGAHMIGMNKVGDAPLHTAVRHRMKGAVRCLLQQHCDVNILNACGKTALDIAKSAGYREMCVFLRQQEMNCETLLVHSTGGMLTPNDAGTYEGVTPTGARSLGYYLTTSVPKINACTAAENKALARVRSASTGYIDMHASHNFATSQPDPSPGTPKLVRPYICGHCRKRLSTDSGMDEHVSVEDLRCIKSEELRSLYTNRQTLVACMKTPEIVAKLVSYGVLESQVVQEVSNSNPEALNSFIIQNILRSNSVDHYYILLRCLSEINQQYLADALRTAQVKAREIEASTHSLYNGLCFRDMGSI